MGQKVATLEIELGITTGGSVAEINQFGGVVDKVTAQALRDIDRIDVAMQNVGGLDKATAEIVRFADETAKSAINAARELNKIERAGESMAAQLERQLSVFGKSSAEIRQMKAETAALSAEQAGMTELASRIRALEADLYAAEHAEARKAEATARAAAEDRDAAAAARELADAAQAAARAVEAQGFKQAAIAHQMFEARVRQGIVALKEEEDAAARDAIALARLREMLDPAAAAQERLNRELAEAARVMQAAGLSGEDLAQVLNLIRERGLGVATVSGTMRIGMQQLSFQMNDVATMFAMGAPAMQIFASQAGQVIQALQLMAGEAGGLLGFLGGPWGMVLTTAAVVAAPFVAKLWEGADAAGKKEAAALTLTDAIAKLDQVTGAGHRTHEQDVQDAYAAARALYAKELQVRRTTQAQLEAAIAERSVTAQRAQGFGDRGDIAALGVPVLDNDVARLQRMLAASQKALDHAAQGFRGVIADRIGRQVADQFDAAGAATRRYETQQARLNEQYRHGKINRDQLTEGLTHSKQVEEAAVEATKHHAAAREHASTVDRDAAKAAREAAAEMARLSALYSATEAKADPIAKAYSDYAKELEGIADLKKAHLIDDEKALEWQLGASRRLREDLAKTAKAHGDLAGWGKTDFAEGLEASLKSMGDLINRYGPAALLAKQADEASKSFDNLTSAIERSASIMEHGFGKTGGALAVGLRSIAQYRAEQRKIEDQASRQEIDEATRRQRSIQNQIGLYGDVANAAQGYFERGSAGYKALGAAETAFRAIQFALSLKAMAQDAAETGSSIAKSLLRTGQKALEAVVSAIASLPFPLNIAAGAATIAALAAIGVSVVGSFGGGSGVSEADYTRGNTGTGTVLGNSDAKSESIVRTLEMLKSVDDATLNVNREMLTSLRSIENSLGGLSTLLIREGNINASEGVTEGFKMSTVGSILSKIPLIGGILGSLFGTSTKVVGSGLYGSDQSVGDILSGGFDASYYSDVQRKKKFFGITTSTKYSTNYTGADPGIENQFTLLIKQFYDAIGLAAGPLGQSLGEIEGRLDSFVISIGKIDLAGLSGDQIQEKLSAVFGKAADDMARAGLPGLEKFQKVGEGYFETLVRVASTVEQVDAVFRRLGVTTTTLGVDVDMAIANMFDSASDFTSLANGYFEAFYTEAEQNAAKTRQLAGAFASIDLAMPDTIAGFRALVDAQDLMTDAGRATYVTLLQLAPAFADLKGAMSGAASAAAIVREREDLQQKLLELEGDTTALRAAELAKLDPTNRALQQQIYAIEDAQAAAKAAEQLRDAWASVGDSIMDEVRRIRGLSDAAGGKSFAALMGQFNAATDAARAGDQDAAKSLPGLSKSLLDAAALAATSRQELDRVQAATASSLEDTYAVINRLATATGAASPDSGAASTSAAATSATISATSEMADLRQAVADLTSKLEQMRTENNAGHAATASNTGGIKKAIDNVTTESGGNAIAVMPVAA